MNDYLQISGMASSAEGFSEQIVGLDHVAIAVPNLEDAISWYCSALGFKLVERRTTYGVSTSMISAVLRAGSAIIVLVQGIEPESQVSRFVDEFGPGVQHVAFTVKNIDAALLEIFACGSYTDTSILSDVGIRQVFLCRNSQTGVRIELIERNGGEFTDESVQRLFVSMEKNGIY
jgi:methylmalonyl-CoA/ethylmalonyl-CoA epimerase